jgi:hypothetical protein
MMRAARRVYHDLIRRRTVVRISDPVESLGAEPVFLIAPYRSGTTMMRLILDSHSQLACPPETTVFPALHRSIGGSDLGLSQLGFGADHVRRKFAECIDYFYSSYAASSGKRRWVDKSPENVWVLDFLIQMFPTAKFVLLTRHPLDQVASHTSSGHDLETRLSAFRRNGEDIRIAATRYWVAASREQQEFARSFGESAKLVRYEDVCTQPYEILPQLFRFLGEEWEPAVVNFGEHKHDFGLADDRARTSRSPRLRTGAYIDWPAEILAGCLAVAEPSLQAFGYEARGR